MGLLLGAFLARGREPSQNSPQEAYFEHFWPEAENRGKVVPRRLISCENAYFLKGFADGTVKIPHFLGFEGPGGSILRSNCGPDGSLDVERGLGGPGTSKTHFVRVLLP